MKLKDLIKELQTFEDQEQIVVIPGYEGGLDDVTNIEQIFINLNVNTASYYGPHEETTTSQTTAIKLY